jgi:hypothetical protein
LALREFTNNGNPRDSPKKRRKMKHPYHHTSYVNYFDKSILIYLKAGRKRKEKMRWEDPDVINEPPS